MQSCSILIRIESIYLLGPLLKVAVTLDPESHILTSSPSREELQPVSSEHRPAKELSQRQQIEVQSAKNWVQFAVHLDPGAGANENRIAQYLSFRGLLKWKCDIAGCWATLGSICWRMNETAARCWATLNTSSTTIYKLYIIEVSHIGTLKYKLW